MSFIIRNSSLDNHLEPQYQNFKSLHKDGRKAELQRVTRENKDLLRRIQHVEPAYDHLEWTEDARQHGGWLENLCEYPVVDGLHLDPAQARLKRTR